LVLERRDEVLVEFVARHDARVAEASLVEQGAGAYGQPRKVARVYPHAEKPLPTFPKPTPHLDRAAHTIERVVGIDEQHDVVG